MSGWILALVIASGLAFASGVAMILLVGRQSEERKRPGYIIPPATSAEGEVYTAGDWNRHLERSTR